MFVKSGLFVVSDTKTNKSIKFKDFIITMLLCLLAMVIVFSFIFVIKIPSINLMEPKEVYGEMSNPTLARLILMITDFIIVALCLFISIKSNKREQVYLSSFLSYLGGTFLWQAIGECSWHFGFYRIETYPSLLIALLLVILLVYVYKKKGMSWSVLILVSAFMLNWLGHLALLTPASLLSNIINEKLSYIIFGSIFGGLFLLYCLYKFIFQSIGVKARILSTMGVFISVCSVIIAIVEAIK